MIYLAIIVLMLVAFTVVGWPLVGSSRALAPQGDGPSRLDALLRRRDAAYRAIKDLDFEHELGNLSDSDYQGLRERYRREAAGVLQQLDDAAKAEAERAADASEAAPVGERASARACPSCGKPRGASDRFCWSCGARLGEDCPECGTPAQPGDRFCARCGTRLKGKQGP